MATLSRDLRRELERVVIRARRVAEEGARKALAQLAVDHHKPWSSLTPSQRSLRNRLRAHGRQLGDRRDEKRGTQAIDHLVGECAYEHWHRMLFARFLAECDLLIEPETGVAISLDECRELARERGADWLALASQFAVRMLPQIFRAGDAVLEVALPPETRHDLEELLKSIQREVFTADDSLGWVYQFWQAERKDEVNKSEKKIGADELAAVTQLFTEDYMVLFLLHNTLGAWWAGKVLAAKPEIASQAKDEDELRAACSVGGYEWTYLRFAREGEKGPWRPAAGIFDGWPRAARDLKVLDPCEGSGHFLVFALPILVAFRMEEESLSREQAVDAVLRDNLFGLELDNRCTQIAAFNLALAVWRMVGYRSLPRLNIACSGLGINAREEDWLKLAGKDERVRETMRRLYHLFEQAPVLGSLIDPERVGGTLFVAEFEKVQPLLEKALATEQTDETASELAVTARGLVHAARILAGEFTLVATNVPYLGRGKQDDVLKEHCDRFHSDAKPDLATCFVDRCLAFTTPGGTAALVTTQYWVFLSTYKRLRQRLLRSIEWKMVARLGPGAFDAISGEVVNVALFVFTRLEPGEGHTLFGIDVSDRATPDGKATALQFGTGLKLLQCDQLRNPDARIILGEVSTLPLLETYASTSQGLKTGDDLRFRRSFWELDVVTNRWRFYQTAAAADKLWDGMDGLIDWKDEGSSMARYQGSELWGKRGAAVGIMGNLYGSGYLGQIFDSSISPVVPKIVDHLPAIQAFVLSENYKLAVRKLDAKVAVTTATLVKVPFDLAHWQGVAAEKYGDELPKPSSADPTQWLFNGHPKGSEQPLQVAVARLAGYRWPRQRGSSFPDCPALGPDGLESHADTDGIVCLSSIKGESAAADRLRALLADAFGSEWSATKQAELLSQVGYAGKSLEEWLRDGFFEQHCELFHQRPFIWHIWDGLKNGFHALVNYHMLAGPKGGARQTLEKLIYTYLGDWTDRQRADQKAGVEGADLRVAAAQHLKAELKKILEGEPPYDIFVRWKPLDEQPIGWEPDINDGVRMNIRPFIMAKPLNGRGKNACVLRYTPKIRWDKDRGKEPHRPKDEYPWFWSWDESTQNFAGGKEFDGNRWNDLHYIRKSKQSAGERHAARQKEHGK